MDILQAMVAKAWSAAVAGRVFGNPSLSALRPGSFFWARPGTLLVALATEWRSEECAFPLPARPGAMIQLVIEPKEEKKR